MRSVVSLVTFILTIIGALNWLLVGLSRFDLVQWAFGRRSTSSRVVYDMVGVAGLTQLGMYLYDMFWPRRIEASG